MSTTEYPPRHIPGFRPLVPGEMWHRTDFNPDMLPEGWRPLLLGEEEQEVDQCWIPYLKKWNDDPADGGAMATDYHRRTRRPLPPPPPTFEHDDKTWSSHVPGEPCPVDKSTVVQVFTSGLGASSRLRAEYFGWRTQELDKVHWGVIIGYRIADAEPQNYTAKLRERIAELEQELATWETEIGAVMPSDFKDWHQNSKNEWPVVARSVIESLSKRESQAWDHLTTALTPRPIAEAGEVKEGFVRLYGADCRLRWVFDTTKEDTDTHFRLSWVFDTTKEDTDTHFIDIHLPSPDPRAEYERAVAEAGGAFEAWLKAKGGVK